MSGDMTSITDTSYNRLLKSEYSHLEQELMIKLLTEEPNKTLSQKRDDFKGLVEGVKLSQLWACVQGKHDIYCFRWFWTLSDQHKI